MRKVVAYCATENLYDFMYLSACTLLEHNTIDKIYFIIETDDFPHPLRPEMETINVKYKNFFNHAQLVYENALTYMSYMRIVLTKILPHESRVLYLDCDIIVDKNIEDVFDYDISNVAIAGCRETYSCHPNKQQINTGFLYMNLEYMRKHKTDDLLVYYSCRRQVENGDQSIINLLPRTELLDLPVEFNGTGICVGLYDKDNMPRTRHFAGFYPDEYIYDFAPYFKKYLNQTILTPAQRRHQKANACSTEQWRKLRQRKIVDII